MQGIRVTLNDLLALRYIANQLQLPQQKLTGNSQQGNFQSPFRGRGMDFVETRVYQPGDDVRTINWSVTARTGKPHTKIYQQERDRPIYLIVDFTPSMFFGTRKAFKSVIAAEIATIISWAGLKNGDRIGGLLLKDTFQVLPPCSRKQSLIELLKTLVRFSEKSNPSIVDYRSAFQRLKKNLKSGSLIYFLSDFYNMDEVLVKELQQLAKAHDVTNILIYDPLEKSPPKEGHYLFHDISTEHTLLVDTHNKNLCLKYSDIFNHRMNMLKKLCFASGMQLIEMATDDDVVKVLRQVLKRKL